MPETIWIWKNLLIIERIDTSIDDNSESISFQLNHLISNVSINTMNNMNYFIIICFNCVIIWFFIRIVNQEIVQNFAFVDCKGSSWNSLDWNIPKLLKFSKSNPFHFWQGECWSVDEWTENFFVSTIQFGDIKQNVFMSKIFRNQLLEQKLIFYRINFLCI